MRVAYLVQSHRSPAQLLRLVRTLRTGSPEGLVHVSHDERGTPLGADVLAAFDDLGRVVVRADRGGYGDWSHVARWLGAVADLRARDEPVDWVTNLTGQDYPLRPLRDVETDLAAATAQGVDAFLEHFDVFGPDSTWPAARARSRYLYRHRRLAGLSPAAARRLRPLQVVNRVQPWLRLHVAYGLTVGVRRPSVFSPAFRLYGGSAYSTLAWPVARQVLERAQTDRALVAQFDHGLSPEEAFTQTVLLNDPSLTVSGASRRYFDFRGSQLNHPRVLTAADLPAALASGADFGRKFDLAADPEVFDRLDEVVLAQR